MDENLEIIVGEQKVFHGVGREKLTIDQHLAKEWNKDIGKPMCIYNIKKIIVNMRRKTSDALSGVQFEEYLTKYQEEILSEFVNTNIEAAKIGGGVMSKTKEERSKMNFIRGSTF